jgi:hypothetical protein
MWLISAPDIISSWHCVRWRSRRHPAGQQVLDGQQRIGHGVFVEIAPAERPAVVLFGRQRADGLSAVPGIDPVRWFFRTLLGLCCDQNAAAQ